MIFVRSFICLRRSLKATLVIAAFITCHSALATSCNVVSESSPSEADNAFLHRDYGRAVTLYQQELQQKPSDPDLTAKLARALLSEQKVSDADLLIQQALTQEPKSAPLLTTLGEVQYRKGAPWLAASTVTDAMKLDPCNARLHLLNARIVQLRFLYATSAREIATAHAIDPHDPEILLYLDSLKQRTAQHHKPCTLIAGAESATLPLAFMLSDGNHLTGYGLDVKFNDRQARLKIGTSSTGLVISRYIAERAGLKLSSLPKIGGSESKEQASNTAFVDNIKIGSLEFRDCEVRVSDQNELGYDEGLINLDVFSRFLVTLDYPVHTLILGPLPPRPGETAPSKPSLETDSYVGLSNNDSDTTSTPTESASSSMLTASTPRDRYIDPEMKDWTPVYRIGHNLLVPAKINETELRTFLLNTGTFTTTVSPDAAHQVAQAGSLYSHIINDTYARDTHVRKILDEITFHFAHISRPLRDTPIADSTSMSSDLGFQVSGFIGVAAMELFTVSIDYRDGLIKFSYDPKRGYHLPYSCPRTNDTMYSSCPQLSDWSPR